MDRPFSPTYLPAKEALIPKQCRFCHQFMEIKQINLTVAVRQCYKCSIPLRQLEFDDIEFFHRSYEDIQRAPQDWSSNVHSEDSELHQLELWIEQCKLTVNKYADSSDDEEPTDSRNELGKSHDLEVINGANDEFKWDDLVDSLNLDGSHPNQHTLSEWNNDAIDELDAALAKAVSEKYNPRPLPFSLDDIISGTEAAWEVPAKPCDASIRLEDSPVAIPRKDEDAEASLCLNSPEQPYLSETAGVFISGSSTKDMFQNSGTSQGSPSADDSVVTLACPDNQDNCTVGQASCSWKSVKTVLHSSEDENDGPPPLSSTISDNANQRYEQNEMILQERTGKELPIAQNCPESDATSITDDTGNTETGIECQPYQNQVKLENHACCSDKQSYSRKEETDPKTTDKATSSHGSVLISFPASYVSPGEMEGSTPGFGSMIYRHICDCDDTVQLRKLSDEEVKEQSLEFELPELPFLSGKVFGEKVKGDDFAFPSEIEKVIFKPIDRTTKIRNTSTLKKLSNIAPINSKDAHIEKEVDLVFETSDMKTDLNVREAMVVTVPADDDITEEMLQEVCMGDLPIIMDCSDGTLMSIHSISTQDSQSECEKTCDILCYSAVDEVGAAICQTESTSDEGKKKCSPNENTVHGSRNIQNSQEVESINSERLCIFEELETETDNVEYLNGRDSPMDDHAAESSRNSEPFYGNTGCCQLPEHAPQPDNEEMMYPFIGEDGPSREEREKTFVSVVDQPLQMQGNEADNDDDDLSSFSGAKFKPLAGRGVTFKKNEPPTKSFFMHLLQSVKREVRFSRSKEMESND